jgi:cation-transporting ATPase E
LVDKLRLVTDPRVVVIRDKKQTEIPVDEVVLSDIGVLSSGDQICVDAIVLNGRVNVDESLLTANPKPFARCRAIRFSRVPLFSRARLTFG